MLGVEEQHAYARRVPLGAHRPPCPSVRRAQCISPPRLLYCGGEKAVSGVAIGIGATSTPAKGLYIIP